MGELGEIAEKSLTPQPPRKRFIIENLDPGDLMLRLTFPNMIKEHVARYRHVFDFMKGKHPKIADRKINILDIASSRGYGSAILAEEFPKATIVGFEARKEYVQKAIKKYGDKRDNLNYIQADARRIPIADNSIDVATAFEITEHLPKDDQAAFVKEIFRVLKNDGIGFISVPHRYSFEKNPKGETVRNRNSNTYHLYEPLLDEADQYIKDSGLEVIGRFGQIMVSEKQADRATSLNKIVPIWPIFAWVPKRDVSVVNVPEGKVGATNIYVVKKTSTPPTK